MMKLQELRSVGLTACLLCTMLLSQSPTHAGISRPDTSPGESVPVPENTWITFSSRGFPAEIVGYDATVYASSIKRHIVLGKYHHFSSEPNYCMDAWSYDENRWDILDCGAYWHTEHAMEGGHPVGAFVYMPKRDAIVYWGGQSGSNQPEQAFHTWWWDVSGTSGRDKLSSTRPGNIKVSAMAYDESRDEVVFFPDAVFKTEIYSPATNQWAVPNVSGTPPPRGLTFSTLEWNSRDHLTYLFGGATGNNCNSGTLQFNQDVYSFSPAENRWRKLEIQPDPVHGSPDGRWYAGFAYDPKDNIFLLAGGQKCSDAKPGAAQIGLTDTWKLEVDTNPPRWTRLEPKTDFVLKNSADAPFQKLRYDPDHGAFVMILPSFDHAAFEGGSWANYAARVWVYCYRGGCPDVGTARKPYPLPDKFLNGNGTPNEQTWASDTAVAADSDAIYAAWIETGPPFSNGQCVFHHLYVHPIQNDQAQPALGSDCIALDSTASKFERDGEKPSLALVHGSLWASWSESNTAAAIPNTIFAKQWNGTMWVGGPIGTRNPSPHAVQGFSQLASIRDIPTIALIENNKTLFPDLTEAYVDQYDGTAWRPLGGKLNLRPNSRVESIGIAPDADGLTACWTEETLSGWTAVSPAQLFCSHWSGAEWKQEGSSLNVSQSDWAAEAGMAFADGKPFVAWTERPTGGSAMLHVKAWNGSAWVPVGGTINKNSSTGWVFHPRLVADGRDVFLSWEEQENLGQHPQLYVARWDGTRWQQLGGSLNMDKERGSAMHSSIAMAGRSPIVVWTEVQLGQLQQVYAKKWDGSRWISIEPVRSALPNGRPH